MLKFRESFLPSNNHGSGVLLLCKSRPFWKHRELKCHKTSSLICLTEMKLAIQFAYRKWTWILRKAKQLLPEVILVFLPIPLEENEFLKLPRPSQDWSQLKHFLHVYFCILQSIQTVGNQILIKQHCTVRSSSKSRKFFVSPEAATKSGGIIEL